MPSATAAEPLAGNAFCQYVSKKIRQVLWKPLSPDSIDNSNVLVSGSWDDEDNELALWYYGCPSGKDKDNYEISSTPLDRIPHSGDVTSLKNLGSDNVVSASSDGSVRAYHLKYQEIDWKIEPIMQWNHIHHFKSQFCPCTAVAVRFEHVVSVGEDGRLVAFDMNIKEPVRIIESADGSCMYCVEYIRQSEVLSTNIRGQLKLWDLRVQRDQPSSIFAISPTDAASILCMAQHPTQAHIIACGTETGGLCVWDLRKEKYPIVSVQGHENALNAILFHPTNPAYLYTCSENGDFWLWNGSNKSATFPVATNLVQNEYDSSWLCEERGAQNIQLTALVSNLHVPFYCLSADRDKIACGADNEAIYIFNNIKL